MKRVSDVFDFKAGVGYPASWSDEQVRLAERALRNVDALADALDDLITAIDRNELLNSDFNGAKSALAAYREGL